MYVPLLLALALAERCLAYALITSSLGGKRMWCGHRLNSSSCGGADGTGHAGDAEDSGNQQAAARVWLR